MMEPTLIHTDISTNTHYQGTSSSRVIPYDRGTLDPVISHQVDLTSATQTPKAGWAQMDAKAIIDSVNDSARGALDKVKVMSI